MLKKQLITYAAIGVTLILLPQLGYCDVEGTLNSIQDTLVGKLMPLFGTLGICWAAFSFFMGNPNAKTHLFLAITGAIIGFGSSSIISYVQSVVN